MNQLFSFRRGLGALLLALLVVGAPAASAQETVLKGRIIRALSVDTGNPDLVLVGQKGSKAGSALVFESRDGGLTWRTLNNGQPLSAQASDVQAVLRVNDAVILAGTWKQGLYRSRDNGARFARIKDFPSSDIRDLTMVRKEGRSILYAATARQGVFRSDDAGASWQPLGPGQDFFWSLTSPAGGRDLYAVSLEQAVYRNKGTGDWEKIFAEQNAFALAASGRHLALAAEAGVFLSDDAGATWHNLPALQGEKFADALFLGDDAGTLLLASWSDGLVVAERDGRVLRRLLPGLTIVHLQVTGDRLLAGTWGKGLMRLPLEEIGR